MKTSNKGIALIKQFEGFAPISYLDAAHIPTIGYGHVISAGEKHLANARLTESQATQILMTDISRFEAAVLRSVKVTLSQSQFDALVSFSFNVGSGALASSTLLRKLNAGDYVGAQAQFMVWNKATVNGIKIELAGLTRRRKAEAALFGEGV